MSLHFGGWNRTARFYTVVAVLSLFACRPALAQFYTIQEIPPPPGGINSVAEAINDSGDVAVDSVIVSASNTSGMYHAFLYQAGKETDLGTLGTLASAISYARGINASDQVVGESGINSEFGLEYRAFLYDSTGMHDLGTLGGDHSFAFGINNAGKVVGFAFTTSAYQAFLYDSSGMHDLGALGVGANSTAYAINNADQVVGESSLVPDNGTTYHAFLYSAGQMKDLGTFGGAISVAQDINDKGQVVGFAGLPFEGSDPSLADIHAFLYDAGGIHDLGTMPGDTRSYATAINNLGQIVGYSGNNKSQPHAFIYRNGQLINLNDLLVDNVGWTLSTTAGINNQGQIVGNGLFEGQERGFILTPVNTVPVPEPGMFALIIGVAAFSTGLALRRQHCFWLRN